MGASSGWNLVARRPSRARVATKRPARHLVSVPCGPDAEAKPAPQDAEPKSAGAALTSVPD